MKNHIRRIERLEAIVRPGRVWAVAEPLRQGKERTYTVLGRAGLTLADIERLWPGEEVVRVFWANDAPPPEPGEELIELKWRDDEPNLNRAWNRK